MAGRTVVAEYDVPTGHAADQIDRVVHEIVRELKQGRPVTLDGFGTLKPGAPTSFNTEKSRAKKR